MSNITKAIRAIIQSSELHGETLAAALAHFDEMSERAEKYAAREITLKLEVDTAKVEEMRGNLEKFIADKMKGYSPLMHTEPALWVPVTDERKPKHKEGVIVTDGTVWGLSHYNDIRAKTGVPFPVIYDVCAWEVMGEVTHWLSMDVITLPEGGVMSKPVAVIVNRNAVKSPCCKAPFQWHQIHGMRLTEEVDGFVVYKARCPECGLNHWVRK